MIITFCGLQAHLTGQGMLWLPEIKTLAAADLHFEKSTFFSRFATLLPPYDSMATLEKLEAALQHYRPKRFLALGDSFHDKDAASRLNPELARRLNGLTGRIAEWVWITGNHDPDITAHVAGNRAGEILCGNLMFRHRAAANYKGAEISGHFHPKLSISLRHHRMSGPCFVINGEKLILPAFGAFTGGLNVKDPAFVKEFPHAESRYYLLNNGDVYDVTF